MFPRLVSSSLINPSAVMRTLKAGAKSDTSVVVGVMIFQNLLRIVSSIILTRLLNVEAFAVAGIVTSVMVTFGLISDVGIVAFMVRHPNSHEREFRDQVWTLRLLRGIFLSAVIALLSGPLSNFMQKPELQGAIAAAGLYFILDGFGSLAPFTALRNRRVRMLSAIDVLSQFVGIGISVVLAIIFRSYWALILSNLMGQIIAIIFSYRLYPESGQRFNFSRARSSELWKFSRMITFSTMLTLVITQGDKLLLSRVFSLEVMGLYIIAANLAAAPASLVGTYAGRVLYPVYAEIFRNSPDTLKDAFYRVKSTPTLLYAFAAGGFIGCAPAVIAVLYDPRYLNAGMYLQILLISSFFSAGNSAANDIMITLGKTSFTFYANLTRLAYLAIGAFAGWNYFGAIGIIWAVGTVEFVAQIYAWIALGRIGYLRTRQEILIILVGLGGLFIGFLINTLARYAFDLY